MVADIAAGHGVHLAYADIADTPDRCRSFLEGAGFKVVAIRTEFANTDTIELTKALEFWDDYRDHSAWQSLNQAQPTTREGRWCTEAYRRRDEPISGLATLCARTPAWRFGSFD